MCAFLVGCIYHSFYLSFAITATATAAASPKLVRSAPLLPCHRRRFLRHFICINATTAAAADIAYPVDIPLHSERQNSIYCVIFITLAMHCIGVLSDPSRRNCHQTWLPLLSSFTFQLNLQIFLLVRRQNSKHRVCKVLIFSCFAIG